MLRFTIPFIILLLSPLTVHATNCEFINSNQFTISQPATTIKKICHIGYDVLYDEKIHDPILTFYNVDPRNVKGRYKRVGSFRTDPSTRDPYVLDAYSHTGYDRGHIAPAGIFRRDRVLNIESFYQTNMTPQLANFNRGIWKRLETKVRKYVIKSNRIVHVIAGPIFTPPTKVLYDKQGNVVNIPSGFFKIIVDGPNVWAYKFANKRQHSKDLPKMVTSIDVIESLIGIDLFTNLNLNESIIVPYSF